LYPTGDEYLPVACKWFVNDPGVFKELSKNGLALKAKKKEWIVGNGFITLNGHNLD